MSDVAPPPPPPPPPPTGATTKKPPYKRWWFWTAAAFVVLIIIGAVAGSGSKKNGSTTTTTQAAAQAAAKSPATTTTVAPTTVPPHPTTTAPRPTTTTAPPPPPPPTTAAGPKTRFGDGTWAVNSQIAPGTYYTPGGSGCYWERDSSLNGGANNILANQNLNGPGIVSILSTDAGFTSQNCGTWSTTPTSGPLTSFGDGDYAVGVTLAPGTYSTQGGGNCYYEEDSDFTNSGNSILANNNQAGPATITIASPTVEFVSQGCGTWTKTG